MTCFRTLIELVLIFPVFILGCTALDKDQVKLFGYGVLPEGEQLARVEKILFTNLEDFRLNSQISEEDLKEADFYLKEYKSKFPKNFLGDFYKGIIEYQRGNFSEALKKISVGNESFGEKPNFIFLMGEINVKIKDFKTAKNYLLKAIKKNPLNGNYHLYIAICYEKLSNKEKAIEHYRIAFEFNPIFTLAKKRLKLLLPQPKEYPDKSQLAKTLSDDNVLPENENDSLSEPLPQSGFEENFEGNPFSAPEMPPPDGGPE